MKRVNGWLHLLAGIALLGIAAYSFRGLSDGAQRLWRQQSSVAAGASKSTKSGSASDDLVLSADTKVYGVLSQQDEKAGGDDGNPAPSSGPPSSLERVNAADAGVPNHFVHRRLSVETSQIFQFEIPPHAIRPELKGTFRPVATRRNPSGPSVEVLLMNDREFARFVSHRPVTATFSSNPSSRGEIRWELQGNARDSQKYYLVFRNSSAGPSVVDADFTASFE